MIALPVFQLFSIMLKRFKHLKKILAISAEHFSNVLNMVTGTIKLKKLQKISFFYMQPRANIDR